MEPVVKKLVRLNTKVNGSETYFTSRCRDD